jgi:RecA-family ATPase
MISVPVVNEVIETIRANKLDVFQVDPFVSSHRVTENDNNAIDRVAKTWARIADQTGVAIELVHHVRKTAPGQEITVEDGRGASALLAAARSARVLNPMAENEANSFGLESKKRVCLTSSSFTINKTAAARTLCTILVPMPL